MVGRLVVVAAVERPHEGAAVVDVVEVVAVFLGRVLHVPELPGVPEVLLPE